MLVPSEQFEKFKKFLKSETENPEKLDEKAESPLESFEDKKNLSLSQDALIKEDNNGEKNKKVIKTVKKASKKKPKIWNREST